MLISEFQWKKDSKERFLIEKRRVGREIQKGSLFIIISRDKRWEKSNTYPIMGEIVP